MECPHEGKMAFCCLPLQMMYTRDAWICPRGHVMGHVEWLFKAKADARLFATQWDLRRKGVLK